MALKLQRLGPSYCISLASQAERRVFCRQQFDAERLDVTFVDGIQPPDKGRFPTRGALGCYLSHLSILERAMETWPHEQATHITIFEDDVLLPRGFNRIVERVMSQLEGIDWHFMYWGMENQPVRTPVKDHPPLVTISPEQTIIGKQAYTVTRETIPGLVEYLKYGALQPQPSYSDGMFHEFRMKNNLPAHTHSLQQARQASFASNITPRRASWLHVPLRAVKRQLQLWTR